MSQQAAIALKSEERRALILLGATAVIATVWAALWTTTKNPQDAFWNFPTGPPFKHLTIYVIPTFGLLVEIFLGYAFFAFWYFSVDWLPGRKGTILRELCHVVAVGILGLYIVAFIAFVPAAEISFFLPDNVQTYYWFVWAGLFVLLEAKVVRFAISQSEQLAQWFDELDAVVSKLIKEAAMVYVRAFKSLIKWLRKKGRKP